MPRSIIRDEFPSALTLAAIEDATPSTSGGLLLRDEVITDSIVETAVESNGLPEAVELNKSLVPTEHRWFAMYYENPPHTLAYETTMSSFDASSNRYRGTESVRMDAVPRSAYRIALGVGPLAPPWPVTISVGKRAAFGVPLLGTSPPNDLDGRYWAHLANSIASEMRQGRADHARRVYQVFRRLELANPVSGLAWKAVLFDSSVVSGFGVPDGTLFVSTGLVEKLNDDQLAAALAHLMGHERYQHYAQNLRLGEQVRLVGSAKSLPEVPKYPEVLTLPQYGFSRWEEVDANRVAVEYLARIDIPPDTLFDALYKLSSEDSEAGSLEWPSFSEIHHLPGTAADMARMLDAGILRSPGGIAESSH